MAKADDEAAFRALILKGQALRLGLKPMFVQILPAGPQVVLFVDSIPRCGELVSLKDGTYYEVEQVWHRIIDYPQHDFATTVTWAVAKRLTGRPGRGQGEAGR